MSVTQMETRYDCRYEAPVEPWIVTAFPVTHRIDGDEYGAAWAHVQTGGFHIVNWRLYDANGHTLLTGHERNHAGTLAGYLRALRRAVLSIRGAYRTGRRTVRVYPVKPGEVTAETSMDAATVAVAARPPRLAEAALERLGFRLLAVEINIEARRARVEVRRHDGYLLTLDVRDGSGSITREWARERTEAVGRRGDRFLARTLHREFVGRTRVYDGPRSALRVFANFIGDNAINRRRIDARSAIALLLP